MGALCLLSLYPENGCALLREAVNVSLAEDSQSLRKRCNFD